MIHCIVAVLHSLAVISDKISDEILYSCSLAVISDVVSSNTIRTGSDETLYNLLLNGG